MLSARGEQLLFADADGATTFEDISKLQNTLKEIIKGLLKKYNTLFIFVLIDKIYFLWLYSFLLRRTCKWFFGSCLWISRSFRKRGYRCSFIFPNHFNERLPFASLVVCCSFRSWHTMWFQTSNQSNCSRVLPESTHWTMVSAFTVKYRDKFLTFEF